MPNLAEKIAQFACQLDFQDIPNSTVHEVKRRLIDSMACAMGAWTAPPVKIARLIGSYSTSELGAGIIGTRHMTTPEMAAFANGAMFRYLDFNDTYLSKEPAHPSDNMAATLAIGSGFGLDGKAFITGSVIAYEIQCRLCDAYSIRKKGWDHVTYGSFSTVAGCGNMMGFDEQTMVHALGLAGVPNNAMRQTRVGELSMWKGCAFANASRNGVFATLLAHHGMTGTSQVFEGEMGFFNEICGGDEFDIDLFGGPQVKGAQIPFMIEQTYIKKYSAEYHSQSAVDAALEIVAQHGGVLNPADIESVDIGTFTVGYEIIGGEPEKWRPQSRETADHSLPFITCSALLKGEITIHSYDEKSIHDEALLGVVAKTKVHADPELDKVYPEHGIPNLVTVKLKSGKTYQSRVDAPSGHALNKMSDQDVEAKFYQLAEPLLTRKGCEEALDVFWNLDRLEDLNPIFESMVV